jgi:hypothetical protein
MNKIFFTLILFLLFTFSSCKKEVVRTYLMVKVNTHIEDETFKETEIEVEGAVTMPMTH